MKNDQYNKTLDRLLDKLIKDTKNIQMKEDEYRYICSLLGKKKFLVFGTGHDSNLWRFANRSGTTIFLEHNAKWITNLNDTHQVKYTTNLERDKHRLLELYKKGETAELEIDLPEEVKNNSWDVILVDSPEGYRAGPGRMQSIYAAKKLANANTDILVHDCNRYVEHAYSSEMFTTFVKQLTKLRHYKV